jgi:GNAT superfamily N-acetyltransferase
MRMASVNIRKVEPADEPRWRALWDDYNRFYEREPREPITRHLWARLFNPASPVYAIVAECDGKVVGLAHYLIQESTSKLTPVCYLQDLFVDPAERGSGIGLLLIDWLLAEVHTQGWSRLYWHTKENNYRARALYDSYTPRSAFVHYLIENS